MQNIPAIIQEIASTASKNEKVALIKKHDSHDMRKVYNYAYNPHITFGTTKFDLSVNNYNESRIIDERWFDAVCSMLESLLRRELTGNRARDKVVDLMESAPRAWAELIFNILNKDLRAGFSASSINKAIPDLIETDFCMLAQPFNAKKFKLPCYVDVKLDGVRTIAKRDDLGYTLYSRNGKKFNNYSLIENELDTLSREVGSYTFDGEITAGHFQDLMRTVSRKTDVELTIANEAIYNIFDVQVVGTPFEERLQFLKLVKKGIEKLGLRHVVVVEGHFISSETEMMDFYKLQLSKGQEGIMVKDLSAYYEFKRSSNWMKIKPSETEDLKIVGVEEGTGKNVGKLGALVCQLENGDTVNVGSGFSDEDREDYWNNQKKVIGKIAEVKYQEKTRDGSLRFPVFVRFRDDKL